MKLKKIKKLIIYVLNLPLYYISKIFPKDKNLWVFGAWFGEKYADNSKYLFEYVNKNHPEIKAIWLSKNKKVIELVRKKGYKAYYIYSFKGYLYSVRAYVGFVSTSFHDINQFIFTKFYINLWHGIPLKKIVYDDKLTNEINYNSLFKKVLKKFFPFIKRPEEFYKIIASSETEAKNLSTAFRKELSDILITGLPRNDVFFIENTKSDNIVRVIYMPTHRNEGEINLSEYLFKDIDKINTFLEKNNIILYIKLHYYHMKNLDKDISYKNIKILLDENINQDIYSKIKEFDMLITDYSSIYFDYLLLDRPIIFAPFDYEKYIKRDREFYYDYYEVTPGPKCKNWDEVAEWIKKFKENPNLYAKERKEIRDRFHKYQDGKSCERVYKEIKRLLDE